MLDDGEHNSLKWSLRHTISGLIFDGVIWRGKLYGRLIVKEKLDSRQLWTKSISLSLSSPPLSIIASSLIQCLHGIANNYSVGMGSLASALFTQKGVTIYQRSYFMHIPIKASVKTGMVSHMSAYNVGA